MARTCENPRGRTKTRRPAAPHPLKGIVLAFRPFWRWLRQRSLVAERDLERQRQREVVRAKYSVLHSPPNGPSVFRVMSSLMGTTGMASMVTPAQLRPPPRG
jgi:hypothetical protein